MNVQQDFPFPIGEIGELDSPERADPSNPSSPEVIPCRLFAPSSTHSRSPTHSRNPTHSHRFVQSHKWTFIITLRHGHKQYENGKQIPLFDPPLVDEMIDEETRAELARLESIFLETLSEGWKIPLPAKFNTTVYTSPYKRAFDTASQLKLNAQAPLICNSYLEEYLGNWKNRCRSPSFANPRQIWTEATLLRNPKLFQNLKISTHETYSEMETRVSKFLNWFMDQLVEPTGESTKHYFVTHGIILSTLVLQIIQVLDTRIKIDLAFPRRTPLILESKYLERTRGEIHPLGGYFTAWVTTFTKADPAEEGVTTFTKADPAEEGVTTFTKADPAEEGVTTFTKADPAEERVTTTQEKTVDRNPEEPKVTHFFQKYFRLR